MLYDKLFDLVNLGTILSFSYVYQETPSLLDPYDVIGGIIDDIIVV